LPVYEVYNIQVFAFKIIHDDACHPIECRAATLPRSKTRWNLQGCLKLANRSQPLVGRSLSYCEDMWGRLCCLTSFFLTVDMYLSCEDTAWQICAMVPLWRFFGSWISSKLGAAHFRSAF